MPFLPIYKDQHGLWHEGSCMLLSEREVVETRRLQGPFGDRQPDLNDMCTECFACLHNRKKPPASVTIEARKPKSHMTDDEMNEALAIFAGMRKLEVENHDADGPISGSTMTVWLLPDEELKPNPYWNRRRPSNYCKDLNAIRNEIIMRFDDMEMLDYVRYLTEAAGCDNEPSFRGYAVIAEADAWHCTKAALQAIGKWKHES